MVAHAQPLTGAQPGSGICVTQNRLWEWLGAAGYAGALFLFFWYYHEWRGKPLSLFTVNKSMAIAAVITLSTCVGLGVLNRRWGLPVRYLRWRRTLGVTGVLLIIPHGLISLFLLPEKFPLSYYLENWLSLLLGTVGMVGLLYLAWISRGSSLRKLGREAWKGRQRLAWVLLAIVLVHFAILGKFPNWIKWVSNPQGWPPGTLPPFLIGSLVLFGRLWEALRRPSS